MPILDELQEKSVLILGLGKEGMSTYSFLRRRFPDKQLGLADMMEWSRLGTEAREAARFDKDVECFLGDRYLECVRGYDLIFRSPGVSPFHTELNAKTANSGRVSSNMELFLENCAGTVIGVTGSKGKSTSASLIYKVLMGGGLDVRLAGNIGMPALSTLDGATPETLFVVEMSSYQLAGLPQSPHVAVLLDICREHTDYHQTFDGYVEAKQTITRYQAACDYLIYNASGRIPLKIAESSRAETVPFGFDRSGGSGCCLEDGFIVYYSCGNSDERIITEDEVPLRGRFNLQNVMPAILTGKLFAVSTGVIADSIRQFKPLEHRLEFITTYNTISFYNDSLSTIPEAAIAAIEAFPGKQVVLIAGGYDRGQDFAALALAILENGVNAVILFPSTGERLWGEITLQAKEHGCLPDHRFVANMRDGVRHAYNLAGSGGVVLLSPGSASFGCFGNYVARGNMFRDAVTGLSVAD